MGRGYRSYRRRLWQNANDALGIIMFALTIVTIGVYAIKWFVETTVFLIVSIVRGIIFIVNTIREYKNKRKSQPHFTPRFTLDEVDNMSGEQFEKFVSHMLVSNGYTNVYTTRSSGDWGVDIVATMNGVVYAMQCKRYDSSVGVSPVQEVHAGMAMYGADRAVVITNSYFTRSAETLAARLDVALWNRDAIKSMMSSV